MRTVPIHFPPTIDIMSLHGAIAPLGLRLRYRSQDGQLEAVITAEVHPEHHGNGNVIKIRKYAGQIKGTAGAKAEGSE